MQGTLQVCFHWLRLRYRTCAEILVSNLACSLVFSCDMHYFNVTLLQTLCYKFSPNTFVTAHVTIFRGAYMFSHVCIVDNDLVTSTIVPLEFAYQHNCRRPSSSSFFSPPPSATTSTAASPPHSSASAVAISSSSYTSTPTTFIGGCV